MRHREDKRASVADEWRYPMLAQTTRVSPRQGSVACISAGTQPWSQGGRCPTGASGACTDGGNERCDPAQGATRNTVQGCGMEWGGGTLPVGCTSLR